VTTYIVRRLGIAVPTLLAVSVILFSLLHLAPGGPMALSIPRDSAPDPWYASTSTGSVSVCGP